MACIILIKCVKAGFQAHKDYQTQGAEIERMSGIRGGGLSGAVYDLVMKAERALDRSPEQRSLKDSLGDEAFARKPNIHGVSPYDEQPTPTHDIVRTGSRSFSESSDAPSLDGPPSYEVAVGAKGSTSHPARGQIPSGDDSQLSSGSSTRTARVFSSPYHHSNPAQVLPQSLYDSSRYDRRAERREGKACRRQVRAEHKLERAVAKYERKTIRLGRV